MKIDLTEGAAGWILLENLRWPDNLPICPHCRTKARLDRPHYHIKNQKTRYGDLSQRKLWRCWNCRKQFSCLVGTVLEGSRISPTVLFHALYLVSQPGGITLRELARQLDVNFHTARRLRKMFYEVIFAGVT